MKEKRKVLFEYILMTIGTILYSAGIALFLDPNSLAPGGISGISIILSKYIPVDTGSIIFVLNIPIIILGFLKLGRKVMWRTFYCLIVNSLMVDGLLALQANALTNDLLISAIAGAGLSGLGIGIIMKNGGTTGGADIIVRILRKKHPHMKTNELFSIMDCAVVALSAVAFKNLEVALYALIAVFVSAFVLERVLYGTDEAKLIYIISDKSADIAKRMLDELEIGVTFIEGRGAYSEKEKDVIMTVMRKTLYPKAEEIVKDCDPQAFMIVSSATEIYGEGYKNIFSEKL